MKDIKAFKLEIFAPEEFVLSIQEAMHKAGAGCLGNYDHIAARIKTKGYWRPLEGSEPRSGAVGSLCSAAEVKIEVHCKSELVKAVVKAVRDIHPYEEPLINIIPLANQFFD